jgi:hypothetical protein
MRNRYRPVLHIPRTSLETLLEILTVLGLITVIAITAWGWLILPPSIPTHYSVSGIPDAYGGKGSLLALPIISICLAALLIFLTRYPHRYNYRWPITVENAPRLYYLARLLLRWIALELVWMFCGLQWMLIQAAQNHTGGAILLFAPVIVLTLIVTIILYMRAASRVR